MIFRVLDIKWVLARTEDLATGWNASVMASRWHGRAISSFIVYRLTGKDSFQVEIWLWLSRIARLLEVEDPWFESHSCKGGFIGYRGRHVGFFLLLPSDTSAQSFGAAHSVSTLDERWDNVQTPPSSPGRWVGGTFNARGLSRVCSICRICFISRMLP